MFLRCSALLLLSSVALSTALFPSSHSELMRVKRRLQDSLDVAGFGGSSACFNDTTVAFSDEGFSQGFEAAAFNASFQPTCSCSEESNLNDFASFFNVSDPTSINFTIFVDQFNEKLGDLYGKSQYGCVNNCEVCYADGSVCAVLETDSAYSFGLLPGNFTLDSLLALGGDNMDQEAIFTQYVDTLDFSYDVCLTYTKGQSGKTCLKVAFDQGDITDFNNPGALPCELTYNGVSCSSCSIDSSCLKATCPEDTNGDAVANKNSVVVDTCQGTGLDGPYQFLKFFNSDSALTVGDLKVGSCDVDLDALGVGDTNQPGGNTGTGGNNEPNGSAGAGGTSTSGAPLTSIMAMITVCLVALVM